MNGAVVDQDERVNTENPADPGAADSLAEEPGPAGDTPAEAGTAESPTSEPATADAVPAPPDAPPPPDGKPHRKRRRRWVIALSIIGAVIVVLIISAFVTAHFTSASSFCDSCHEMEPYYESWQASTHSSVECRECHIPPGAHSLHRDEARLVPGDIRPLLVSPGRAARGDPGHTQLQLPRVP